MTLIEDMTMMIDNPSPLGNGKTRLRSLGQLIARQDELTRERIKVHAQVNKNLEASKTTTPRML
ncbi:hypothetical protein RND71_037135 [Anisodus tanguticus]|uniref:Uncharacterized protein n=1 Tax=Anisodus tanguticus TaxID=243964 RepID=A0AAE1R2V8_9SOLA|nr:hypothetical protein RND71_037135 [Anisodus tanguticus]